MTTLDDLIAAIRDVLSTRFPGAEYAALVIHRKGLPDTVITVTPRPAPEQPALLWPSARQAS